MLFVDFYLYIKVCIYNKFNKFYFILICCFFALLLLEVFFLQLVFVVSCAKKTMPICTCSLDRKAEYVENHECHLKLPLESDHQNQHQQQTNGKHEESAVRYIIYVEKLLYNNNI